MQNLDLSSWQTLLSTLLGLLLVTFIGVGVRLIVMMYVQKRRERENRQINERLRTLIAAYKTLGGSFTGELSVDPRHLRDIPPASPPHEETHKVEEPASGFPPNSERSRRIRDSVENALSDIILLGTDEQVRLAARAASELVAGQRVHTAELVISLRNFIRSALDLDPVPADLTIPRQGPTRPSVSAKGKGEGGGDGGGRGGNPGGGGMGAGGMGLHLGGERHDSPGPQ